MYFKEESPKDNPENQTTEDETLKSKSAKNERTGTGINGHYPGQVSPVEPPLPGSGIEQNGGSRVFNEEPREVETGGLQFAENQAQKMSFLEIIYGILARPRDTFRYVAEARPVLQAVIFVVFVTLFNYSVGLREMDIFNAGLPLGVDVSALLGPFFILGLLITLMAWFLTTAVVDLVSQFFGGLGNGPGLLAAFGFAMLPVLITTIIDFCIGFLGLGAFLGALAGLAGVIWAVILNVLAVSEVEQLSLGRSVAAYFIFPLSIIVIFILFIAFTIAVIGPFFGQLPLPLR